MADHDLWHEPPNSTEQVRKFNHRSGRYAVWGRKEEGGEKWEVMDGQGGERGAGKPVGGPFPSRDQAMREAERFIEDNERSRRGAEAH